MKFYKSKTAQFLAGKGFYIVLAVCMAVMGVAVYSAVDSAQLTDDNKDNSSQQEILSAPSLDESKEELPPMPEINEDEGGQQTQETTPTENEAEASFFMLPINGEIIKGHDETALQYSATFDDMRLHTGADFAPLSSPEVISAGDGKVTSVEENTVLGNVITIDHGNKIIIRYCGINEIKVKAGDTVLAGDILGKVGTVTNECSDEDHIHIEVFVNGKTTDPEEFFSLN